VLEGADEFVAVKNIALAKRLGNREGMLAHGAQPASPGDIEHDRTGVVEGLLSRQQARMLDDCARGCATGELRREDVVVERVGYAVGAKEGDVAVAQFRLEAMRFDLRREADRALEHVAERAVIDDMIVRELREPAAAGEVHARVADIEAKEPVSLDDRD
jgi:hypothetical protein